MFQQLQANDAAERYVNEYKDIIKEAQRLNEQQLIQLPEIRKLRQAFNAFALKRSFVQTERRDRN